MYVCICFIICYYHHYYKYHWWYDICPNPYLCPHLTPTLPLVPLPRPASPSPCVGGLPITSHVISQLAILEGDVPSTCGRGCGPTKKTMSPMSPTKCNTKT